MSASCATMMLGTNTMGRRQFIVGSSVLSFAALPALSVYAGNDPAGSAPPPRHTFGKSSTAEEVTDGMDLSGKTALITGCTSGVGYETMRVLVMRGAQVYGLGRTLQQAERACVAVSGAGVKGSAVPLVCEHTDFSSVAACAETVQKRAVPIDMLICNAGVYFIPDLQLAHGLEKHFVINHLAHFILVNRLLDRVKAAGQGRIVVVGSDAYKFAPEAGIEFDNLSGQRYYDPGKMYGQSKLANGLFVRQLADRLSDTRVTANVVHPGVVMTETLKKFAESKNIDLRQRAEVKTPEQGAATTCYVATNPAVEKISGQYFEDCHVGNPGGHMQDDAMAAKLWDVSVELTRAYL